MTDLGGYFGYERFPAGGGLDPGPGLHFASGRQSLLAWLRAHRVRRLHLPGWSCPAVLEAVAAAGAEPVFHHLGADLRPAALPAPRDGDGLLVLNPCGLHHEDPALPGWAGRSVVIDDTMAFFRGPRTAWPSFNSWRKFLPVPDGATLFAADVPSPDAAPLSGDDGFLRRRAEAGAGAGHPLFRAHEDAVAGWPEAAPSTVARGVLARLDGAAIRRRRRANYARLARDLDARNALALPPLPADAVPLAYPLLPAAGNRHQALWARAVWVPRLWGDDPRLELDAFERRLAVDLLPLPIDHRYDDDDMERLLGILDEVLR